MSQQQPTDVAEEISVASSVSDAQPAAMSATIPTAAAAPVEPKPKRQPIRVRKSRTAAASASTEIDLEPMATAPPRRRAAAAPAPAPVVEDAEFDPEERKKLLALQGKIKRFRVRFPKWFEEVQAADYNRAISPSATYEEAFDVLEQARMYGGASSESVAGSVYFLAMNAAETIVAPNFGYDLTGLTDTLRRNKDVKDTLDEFSIDTLGASVPPWLKITLNTAGAALAVMKFNEMKRAQQQTAPQQNPQ